jgi:hypothetical protein
MNRLDKLQREEKRWKFSQQLWLFERFFSRRIYGPLWLWWLWVSFFLTSLLTTETGHPPGRSFWGASIMLAILTIHLAAILLQKKKRVFLFSKQQPAPMPAFFRLGIYTIPWLGFVAIIWCAFAR